MEWCPAHIGILGNERADDAAKQGLCLPTPTRDLPYSPTEINSVVRSHVLEKWKTETDKQSFNNTYNKFKILPKPLSIYSKNIQVDKSITRLKLGMSLLPASIGKYILGTNPICCTCNKTFDTKHLLLECKELSIYRKSLMKGLKNIDLPTTVHNILFPP